MLSYNLNQPERKQGQMVDRQGQHPVSEGVDLESAYKADGLAVRSAIRAGQAEEGATGLADWWQNLTSSLP